MPAVLIGIDDTDNATSPGTGRLARNLCRELTDRGMRSLGVTRHQFLLDSAIPYTSHNSGACIGVESEDGIRTVVGLAFDFVASASAEGSDPGVCIALNDDVPAEVSDFGRAAQEKVLAIEQSFRVANGSGIKLRGLGGNCLGVIGALGSVGLRAEGNDGRFIDMPGLRELSRRVNAEAYHQLGIEIQYKTGSRQPDAGDEYDTLDWVRPGLINGKPVLAVEWSAKDDAWIPIDRKKSKPSGHST